MQSPMQAAFASWNVVEKWLKEALSHKLPISINGLYGLDEVKKVCRDSQQIRDIVKTFITKGMATQHDLPTEMRTGNKRDRIGFMWNPEYKGESYRPSARVITQRERRASKVTKSAAPKGLTQVIRSDKAVLTELPKAVELVFQGMMITVSRNPENGSMRLVIDTTDTM
jgi:hypothetical protein